MYVAPLAKVQVTVGGGYGGLRRHKGIDLVAASGTPVRAIVAGQYHSAGFSDAHGFWGIWFGDDGNYWNACHLLRPFDARGRINESQIVGLSGESGNVSGPHLHQGVSTRASLTLGTFDPAPIVLTAPQPILNKGHRMYSLINANGSFFIVGPYRDGTGQAVRASIAPADWVWMIEAQRDYATIPAAKVTQFWTYLNAVLPSASGGGGYNPTDPEVVDEAELGGALTSLANVVIADLTPKIAAVGTKVDGLGISHT